MKLKSGFVLLLAHGVKAIEEDDTLLQPSHVRRTKQSKSKGDRHEDPVSDELLQSRVEGLKREMTNAIRVQFGDAGNCWDDLHGDDTRSVSVPKEAECMDQLDGDGDGFITKLDFVDNFDVFVECVAQKDVKVKTILPDDEALPSDVTVSMAQESALEEMAELAELESLDSETIQHRQATMLSKNKKQKAWLVKMAKKLEQGDVCHRSSSLPQTGWSTNSWGVPYPWVSCGDSDDFVTGSCMPHCGKAGRLPQLPVTCGLNALGALHPLNAGVNFCAEDYNACGAKAAEIAFSVLDVMSVLVPPAKALTAAVKMAKAAKALKKVGKAKEAAAQLRKCKDEMYKAVQGKVLKMKTQMKKDLKDFMKEMRKDLKDEVMDEILDEGLHTAVMSTMKDHADLGDIAYELIAAIDPTGLLGLWEAVQISNCVAFMISPMPTDGLDNTEDEEDEGEDKPDTVSRRRRGTQKHRRRRR